MAYKIDSTSDGLLPKLGRFQYEADFLRSLQNNPVCLKKPNGLPQVEIIYDEPIINRIEGTDPYMQTSVWWKSAVPLITRNQVRNFSQQTAHFSHVIAKDKPQRITSMSPTQNIKLHGVYNSLTSQLGAAMSSEESTEKTEELIKQDGGRTQPDTWRTHARRSPQASGSAQGVTTFRNLKNTNSDQMQFGPGQSFGTWSMGARGGSQKAPAPQQEQFSVASLFPALSDDDERRRVSLSDRDAFKGQRAIQNNEKGAEQNNMFDEISQIVSNGSPPDEVEEFVQQHFASALVKSVVKGCIAEHDDLTTSTYTLDDEKLKSLCPMLTKYCANDESCQVAVMFALQGLADQLGYPSKIFNQIVITLHEESVVSRDAFLQWEKKDSLVPGKATAAMNVKQFLARLRETEDHGNKQGLHQELKSNDGARKKTISGFDILIPLPGAPSYGAGGAASHVYQAGHHAPPTTTMGHPNQAPAYPVGSESGPPVSESMQHYQHAQRPAAPVERVGTLRKAVIQHPESNHIFSEEKLNVAAPQADVPAGSSPGACLQKESPPSLDSKEGMTQTGGMLPEGGPQTAASKSPKQDVKLHTVDNPWKPQLGATKSSDDPVEQTEQLVKRFRGILNKLTAQKYAKLLQEIKKLAIDTDQKLHMILELFFNKAVDEPAFCLQYANLCKHLATLKVCNMQDGQNKEVRFYPLLLVKCQKELDSKMSDGLGLDIEAEIKRIEEITEPDLKKKLLDELDDKKRQTKQRRLGTIKLVGELYNLHMLKRNIIIGCIEKLLTDGEEESLECLCTLLRTIGANLERSSKYQEQKQIGKDPLAPYFNKLIRIVDDKKISARVRFMIQDILDMRKNDWKARKVQEENKAKAMNQIHPNLLQNVKQEGQTNLFHIVTQIVSNGSQPDEVEQFVQQQFASALVKSVVKGCITKHDLTTATYTLDDKRLKSLCPMLTKYCEIDESCEVAALVALQGLADELGRPSELLNQIFSVLYEQNVIS